VLEDEVVASGSVDDASPLVSADDSEVLEASAASAEPLSPEEDEPAEESFATVGEHAARNAMTEPPAPAALRIPGPYATRAAPTTTQGSFEPRGGDSEAAGAVENPPASG